MNISQTGQIWNPDLLPLTPNLASLQLSTSHLIPKLNIPLAQTQNTVLCFLFFIPIIPHHIHQQAIGTGLLSEHKQSVAHLTTHLGHLILDSIDLTMAILTLLPYTQGTNCLPGSPWLFFFPPSDTLSPYFSFLVSLFSFHGKITALHGFKFHFYSSFTRCMYNYGGIGTILEGTSWVFLF